jgi:hypothetical protein
MMRRAGVYGIGMESSMIIAEETTAFRQQELLMNKRLACLLSIIALILAPLSQAAAENEADDAYVRAVLQGARGEG